MLDKNTLSQLSKLKSDIQASKEYATGQVAGTNGRFGFVRLEDGRDAFLSPEKMQHVIPGDRVKVSLTKNNKDQLEAHFEALLEQSLSRFLGQYRVTKKGHFVVPLGNAPGMKASLINRWIFLPPKGRGRCKEGDMVVARLTQHPYSDGKASAKVVERIGRESDAHIERLFVSAKYDLVPRYNENTLKQVKDIEQQFAQQAFGDDYGDLTDTLFVTIDAESTRDMDDAIALEKTGEGADANYTLKVAIADPASFIRQNSALAQACHRSGQSLYLLGGTIPMLPETLSNDCFSLTENTRKPSLCCTITINATGKISEYRFSRALIRSRAKLSYSAVGAFLDGESESYSAAEHSPAIAELLKGLAELAALRFKWRQTNCLVNPEQAEYGFEINDQGKIEKTFPRARNTAHKIVEEAMLATNACAGEYLAGHQLGLFTTHTGLRADRLGEVKALLKEENVECEQDLLTMQGFLALINSLSENPDKAGLVPALRRMMASAELSTQAGSHLGIGMNHYATVTSPIRRFADLFNHWAIQSTLGGQSCRAANDEYLGKLVETLNNGKQADRELQQWLICHYTQSLIGRTGKARIRIVTQQGFGARLIEEGIDGFILFPKSQQKSFDAKRMTLSVNGTTFHLEDEVEVNVESVDMEKRRIAFRLSE